MNSARETGVEGPSASKSCLPQVLRDATTRCAEQVGGGIALLFADASGSRAAVDVTRVRAAAGFASVEAAREAAEAVLSGVRDAVASRAEQRRPGLEILGTRASGGLLFLPIVFESRVYGAVAVGAPAPVSEAQLEALRGVAASIALHLDHAILAAEAADFREKLNERENAADSKSEEILKLSEALFAQDIEILRSNEKLGKIEKLKNDFIEKMSRELRTPLNGIIEAIISVLSGENEALSKGAKASLRSALDDGTEFLRTLQNILDLWRIKQRELPIEIQDVNFRVVVEEAIFSIRDTLGTKPIIIEKRFEEPFPNVRTDLAKLDQVLFLLLDNAVKFTSKGKIEIIARVGKGQLACEVRDTGIGICPDDQQFIFDEFYQVDDLASSKYRGAGLGLALVKDLLVLLEGDITMKSEVGRGTSITFQIPVQVLE